MAGAPGRPVLSLQALQQKYGTQLVIRVRTGADGLQERVLKCNICPSSPEWVRRAPDDDGHITDRIPKYVKDHITSVAHQKNVSSAAGQRSLVNMIDARSRLDLV